MPFPKFPYLAISESIIFIASDNFDVDLLTMTVSKFETVVVMSTKMQNLVNHRIIWRMTASFNDVLSIIH